MLSMGLEALVAGVASIGVIVSVLLRSEIVHLLRACSKLVWTTVSTHWHCEMSAYFSLKEL